MNGTEEKERYLVGFIFVMAAITYLGTLRFEFVYDDFPQIVSNPFIKSWRYVPQYFVSSVWKQVLPLSPNNYYRPLFVLATRINYAIFGVRPAEWHLVAVMLHLGVTWLVYLLVQKVSRQFTLAWLSALIFGTHPIHHEVVAWVSASTESLCGLFLLGAFLAYLQSREKSKRLWMTTSCALYAAALLCKETAMILPGLVFVYESLPQQSPGEARPAEFAIRLREAMASTSLYIPVAVAYLIARSRILQGLGYVNGHTPVWVWARTLPSILIAYATHWVYPVHLAAFYDVLYQPGFSLRHVLLPALILPASGATVWIFRHRLGEKTVWFAAAWIMIPLLPALDTFVFSPQELVHDRYFYIPSIGASILSALILDRAVKTRIGPFGLPWHLGAAALVLSTGLAFLGARAASFWADDYTLFSRAHQIAPLNSKAVVNLADDLIAMGKIDAAQDLLEDNFRRHAGDPALAAYLGRVEYIKKHYAAAESYTRQAIALNPGMPDAYFYLGQIQLKQNRVPEAKESMRRATELNPYSAQFRTGYGIVLQLTGECAEASRQFEAALQLDPDGFVPKQLESLRCRPGASAGFTPAATPIPR